MIKHSVMALVLYLLTDVAAAADAGRRPLALGDFPRLQTVEGLSCSRDGAWVTYTVTSTDTEADERKSAVWMVNWAGTDRVRLTGKADSASAPQFSPDGRYVSFLATRAGDEKSQLYVLDRRGGEAQALTHVTGDISDYQWSPDAKRIVLAMSSPEPPGTVPARGIAAAPKTATPIVIDDFHFKEDKIGYVTAAQKSRLYLLDVATEELQALTADPRYDDSHPAWSPDGALLAYTSNHEPDADRSGAGELYVVAATAGASPRRVAQFYVPNHQSLVWVGDGRHVAYMIGLEPRLNAYINDRLAVVSTDGGTPKIITDGLDRAVSAPVLSKDAGVIGVLVEDDRSLYPANVSLSSGRVERALPGAIAVTDQCTGGGHRAVLASTDSAPPELYALENGKLRRLTTHNDALMDELELGKVDDVEYRAADGTEVHALLVKPVGYVKGRRYPAIVWIHGGPNGQDQHDLAFDTYPLQLERQWFAAHGYVVLAVNYRGSAGRGAAFQRSILADWGHHEVEDLLAGADYMVSAGFADPEHLGIGGWSYGGILTDYTIATDTRFKAAISGAGSANQISMFGSDQYALQYVNEIGAPWKNPELWVKISYPFFHADRIRTPTLFMGGEKDFNVPIGGGEQMYQALRTLGVPTELVVYPGQYHIFTRPSYIQDRIVRFLDWFDRFLKPARDSGAQKQPAS